ncbi:MAG: spore germination protein, partial [Clostridia bacterium]|nr:spore germination protein [Clostridia bacterium]
MSADEQNKWKEAFGQSFDLVVNPIRVLGTQGTLVCLDGMVDKVLLEEGVLEPLAEGTGEIAALPAIVRSSSPLEEVATFEDAVDLVAQGDVVLEVEERLWSISLRKVDKRAITEPPTSSVIKGPREGFGEEIAQNISLLRRRIKDKSLIAYRTVVGEITRT